MIRPDLAPAYAGKRILITGGLGFIGSNLARELVEMEAEVTIVDSLVPEYGGLRFNIAGHRGPRHRQHLGRPRRAQPPPSRSRARMSSSTSPARRATSTRWPIPTPTSRSTAAASSRSSRPAATTTRESRVVFASTRQIYGRPERLPVDESHPIAPVDVNGINKPAGEWYHLLYGDVYGIRTSVLRLTNTYGPRMRVTDARQTFLGFWLRQALADEELLVYGDGSQRRDLTYVDDAVAAFLLAAARDEAVGQVFNLGGDGHVSLLELGRAC